MLRRYGRMCVGCRAWRRLYPNPGPCRICGRELHLGETGACRLCTKQAYVLRPRRHALDLEGANQHGQQLYFADTERRLQLLNPKSSRRRYELAPQSLSPLVAVGHRQLALFPPQGRDLRRGQERGFPDVDAPEVAAALKAAVDDYAHHHGLGYCTAWGLDRGSTAAPRVKARPHSELLAQVLCLQFQFGPAGRDQPMKVRFRIPGHLTHLPPGSYGQVPRSRREIRGSLITETADSAGVLRGVRRT